MKTLYSALIACILLSSALVSCEDRDENKVPADLAVNNFVWKGLNQYYLWQSDVVDLLDVRFKDQKDLNNFLRGYPVPEDLFTHLLYKPGRVGTPDTVDHFSVIFADYNQLEGILSGTTKNNGIDFSLYYKDMSQTSVFGIVHYVLPNSDAAGKDIRRGDIFYAINGTTLTRENYASLLGNDSYTLNLADYDSGNITPNGRSVTLTKNVLSENPVLIANVIVSGAHKIGYLVYNGFYPNYESQLNDAFGNFKAQGVTDLVLDLRYNGGGSIETATHLSSMITGQFNGQVFAKEQWNDKLEDYYSAHNPLSLFNLFTNTINTGAITNSLNLTKMYVLTTNGTASASELVINGLEPYINVVQIGDTTIGKNVGSITLYDSPNFSKKDANPNHRYAMQPLVLKIVNKAGFGDYTGGLQPDDLLKEDFNNLGTLGDPGEPLLSAAISRIDNGGRHIAQLPAKVFERVQDKQPLKLLENEMYLEKLPDGFTTMQ